MAYVVDDFPILSEAFVINQAVGLVERGHDLTIFALAGHKPSGGPMHDTVARFGLMDRVFRPTAGSLLIGGFVDGAERADAAMQPWSPVRRGCAFVAQASMMARHRTFDIVHCQFATQGLQILRHAALGSLRFRKLVVHLRGYDVTAFVEQHGRGVYRDLFRRADLFIANCEHFRQRAIQLGCPPDRVTVIGSPIDCSRFTPKDWTGVGIGPCKIIAVGRLVEKKGFVYAIRAVAEIVREHADLSFEIVGEGPLREALQQEIAGLGMEERIRLVGALAHQDIAERLRQADFMIAPSVRGASGDEDAPVNTLKEAMAVGLPVIASRHGGIPELVEDGRHGYLVPERDVAAIANAIRRLLGDPDDWPRMGRLGRQKILSAYDQPAIVERTIEVYRNLLQAKEIAA